MFDPNLGRWLTEDPLGFDAGDANLYRYVGNGPTNIVDPTGLQPPSDPPPRSVADALEKSGWKPGMPLPPGITDKHVQEDHNKLRRGLLRITAKLNDRQKRRAEIGEPDIFDPVGTILNKIAVDEINQDITQIVGGMFPIERKLKLLEEAGAKKITLP